MSIVPHEAKALLQLFCLQPIIFGWRQNSFSGAFASWGKIKIQYFTWADQDRIGLMILDRTGSDSILSDQDWTRTEKFHSLLISGAMVPQLAYWSICNCIQPYESHLPFTPGSYDQNHKSTFSTSLSHFYCREADLSATVAPV